MRKMMWKCLPVALKLSGDWGELWIPHLARTSLIEFYWMMQIYKVTAFAIFELLMETQLEGGDYPFPRPRLGLNSQDIIFFMITSESLNNQDMIKRWRHYFSRKHFRDRFCVDIICLYWSQNSWFCKASWRICYISLFECKGPWMLKTVINCHVWNKRLQN